MVFKKKIFILFVIVNSINNICDKKMSMLFTIKRNISNWLIDGGC